MIDLRPVGYVIGIVVAVFGATMAVPMLVDYAAGNGHGDVFAQSAMLTVLVGGLTALACANGVGKTLSIQQIFLMTTLVWVALPVFGAIPFLYGATNASAADAFFEAMSGLTTTGSTVFSGLDQLPPGMLLWRSMLQWFGGIGIIVVAMVFLPELRVGGMQIFRSEAFDTDGKVLPRAAQIASRIAIVYIVLTLSCAAAYIGVGLSFFDAVNHSMTTLATGGFSTRDTSFGGLPPGAAYVAAVFMILASLPFVRFVQLMAGSAAPIWRDSQVRAFLSVLGISVLVVAFFRVAGEGSLAEPVFREALFNLTSIMTGTGYASTDYQLWGGFAVSVIFFLGLVGGCAGSTCCSAKIFRYQILFAAVTSQIRRIHSPHGIFQPKYEGRTVTEDVISSVMAFFSLFIVSIGVLAVLLAGTGLDLVTALSGAATAIANIGPGLGDEIGPAGNFGELSDTAKWLLASGMLVGRLEVLAVLVIVTPRFWQS